MKSISFALLLASAGAPALAAPAAPQPAKPSSASEGVDAATLAAANRLLEAIDYDGMMQRMLDSMLAQLGPAMKQSLETEIGEPIDDELIQRIRSVQEKYLRADLIDNASVRRAIAVLYARHFTAADLDRLVVLQSDPVMKKWNDVAPAMMGDIVPLLVGLGDSHKEELKAEVKQVVEDYFAEQEPASGS